MTTDHKLEAVKIGIALSTQFTGAALGLLTVIGGVITFLLGQRDFSFFSVGFLILGVVCLLISIYCGFLGIAKARNNGNKGWWVVDVSQQDFNRQTTFGLLGILFFAVSIGVLLNTPHYEDGRLKAMADNQESIIRISEVLLGEYNKNKGQTIWLDSLGAVSGFDVGESDRGFDARQVDVIGQKIMTRQGLSVIFLVGEVDKRELTGNAYRKFGSNISLARARAEQIKSVLQEICKEHNISIITMTRGAFHNGLDVDQNKFASDRQVVIYGLAIGQ